jgi:hypothetical protein
MLIYNFIRLTFRPKPEEARDNIVQVGLITLADLAMLNIQI